MKTIGYAAHSAGADVSHAGFQIGYSSVSQFSREYSRFFGVSPAKDIAVQRRHK